MAVQWMENFSLYNGNGGYMGNGLYAAAGASLINDPDATAPAGSKVARFEFNQWLRKVIDAQTVVGQACRQWQYNLGSGTRIFAWMNVGVGYIASLRVDSNGRIVVFRGDGSIICQSTNPVIVANAWQHIECKLTVHPTAGACQVRVEGVIVPGCNVTNVAVGGNGDTVQSVQLGREDGQFGHQLVKDWVVWDNTGTLNNDFMGSVQVISLLPDGDVSSGWTLAGAATVTGAINSLDDDTSYIQAGVGPIPAETITELQNLPVNVTSVRALMPVIRARKIDGGDGNLQHGLVSGGQVANGVNRPITTAYTYWYDVIERDPATNAAWIPGAVNAARLRINRTL